MLQSRLLFSSGQNPQNVSAENLIKGIQLSSGKDMHNNKLFYEQMVNFFDNKNTRVLKDLRDTTDRMPTDYQDSHFYNMIAESFSVLKETAETKQIKFAHRNVVAKPVPVFGTFDMESLSTFLVVDDQTPAIIFSNGLLKFTQRILEIIIKEQFLRDKNMLTDQDKESFAKNFIDVMISFHLFHDAYYAIPLDLCNTDDLDSLDDSDEAANQIEAMPDCLFSREYIELHLDISDATYLWMAAHEYAHLVLDHPSSAAQTSEEIAGVDVAQIEYTWQQEYDADLLGAMFVMNSHLSYIGAYGIYAALSVLLFGCYSETAGTTSHPPMRTRIDNLLGYLQGFEFQLKHYREIDRILAPKFICYQHFIDYLGTERLEKLSLKEIQEELYQKIDLL